MRHLNIPSLFALVVLLHSPAYASDATLYEDNASPCPITVFADKEWKTLTIRRASDACRINQGKILEILNRTFATIIETKDKTEYESVYLGRIIYYEWLRSYLVSQALTDESWSTETGTPVASSAPQALNAYVEGVLGQPEILDPLNAAAAKAGQHFTGLSCEKILVSSPLTKQSQAILAPKGKRVPFDAICWLKLVDDK